MGPRGIYSGGIGRKARRSLSLPPLRVFRRARARKSDSGRAHWRRLNRRTRPDDGNRKPINLKAIIRDTDVTDVNRPVRRRCRSSAPRKIMQARPPAQHAILLLRKRSRVVNESVALTRKTIIASGIIIAKEGLRKVSSERREKKERKRGEGEKDRFKHDIHDSGVRIISTCAEEREEPVEAD